jgi:hypothetical protein
MMDKKVFLRFLALFSSVAILLLVTYEIASLFWPALERVTFAYSSIIFLYLIILGVFAISMMMVTPQLFVQIIIAGTAIKLLLFGGYTFVILYLDTANARENVVFLLVAYVLFTIIEITSLFKYIKRRP